MKLDKKYKTLIYLGLALGVGAGLYFILSKKKEGEIIDSAVGDEKDKDKENKPSKPTYTSESLKDKATISKATAKKYADTIHKAIDGCGTDEQALYGTLKKLKNDADFNLVVEAYGTRTINCWLAGSCKGGLIQNLKADTENINRAIINNIFKDRGIKLLLPKYDPNMGFCS
jgi:hypothetical protein